MVGLPGPETGPPDGPLPLDYHYVRLVVQIVLLSLLSVLSKEEAKQGHRRVGGRATAKGKRVGPRETVVSGWHAMNRG